MRGARSNIATKALGRSSKPTAATLPLVGRLPDHAGDSSTLFPLLAVLVLVVSVAGPALPSERRAATLGDETAPAE